MSQQEFAPCDPALFGQLVEAMEGKTNDFGMLFWVDQETHNYPVEPDNLRQFGDGLFPKSMADKPALAAGRLMMATALGASGMERLITVYTLNEKHRQRCQRVGELVVCSETALRRLSLEIHRVELNGVIWSTTDDEPTVRRRSIDHEVELLGDVTRDAIPHW